jgi:hypothetical protein
MLEIPLENVVLKVRLLMESFGGVTELLEQTPQPPQTTHIAVALRRLSGLFQLFFPHDLNCR